MGRLRRIAGQAFLCACALGWMLPAGAQTAPDTSPTTVPIGFSKLVFRFDGNDEIGISSADLHLRLIEHMRARGFAAVGAENLVFDKDESGRAQYVVGGTVKEIACGARSLGVGCRVGVEWQVLEVASQKVVYVAMIRAAVVGLLADRRDRMAGLLLDAAMDRLLDRPRFRQALVPRPDSVGTPAFEEATIPRCAPGARVAADASDLLGRVVVVETHAGFGSGFFVSPEGLVMTAAHVVEGNQMTLRLHDGSEAKAVAVRVDPREDVALLRTDPPLTGQRCLPLRPDTASAGTEVYAVGAPTSLALAFSLTRGIVSGYPMMEERRRLQTDASVNPGNSGGPIVDAGGAALGVVSFKLASAKVQGLAFAVPVAEALRALNLRLDGSTDPRLLVEKARVEERADATFVDKSDPVPSFDPEGDRRRAQELAREKADEDDADRARRAGEQQAAADADRARRTPRYIPLMRWGGLTVGALGAAGVVVTFADFDRGRTPQSTFDTLRTWNTISWTAAAVGAGSFALSFVLEPLVFRTSSLRVGPSAVGWGGAF